MLGHVECGGDGQDALVVDYVGWCLEGTGFYERQRAWTLNREAALLFALHCEAYGLGVFASDLGVNLLEAA